MGPGDLVLIKSERQMKMKKIILTMATALAMTLGAAGALSLAEARAKIGEAISDPAVLTSTMKQLAAADQAAFVSEVNTAISKMPGSNEAKTSAYLNCAKAALRGAAKGNLITIIAEIFATVPPESLTVVNERLAADVFNRAADSSVTYTDAQIETISKKVMEKVTERCATTENAAVRETFALLMLVRASNGSPATLQDTLVEMIPQDMQATAKNEWIPQALGEGVNEQTYEPMLGAADAPVQVNIDTVMRLAGPQLLESMLPEVVEGTPTVNTMIMPEQYASPILDEDLKPSPVVEPDTYDEEPQGYQGQIPGMNFI